jgi:hypothetical protein
MKRQPRADKLAYKQCTQLGMSNVKGKPEKLGTQKARLTEPIEKNGQSRVAMKSVRRQAALALALRPALLGNDSDAPREIRRRSAGARHTPVAPVGRCGAAGPWSRLMTGRLQARRIPGAHGATADR